MNYICIMLQIEKNLQSILDQGLLINPSQHAYASFGKSVNGKIFLAFSAEVAESYAEGADEEIEDIVVLKIKFSSLSKYVLG